MYSSQERKDIFLSCLNHLLTSGEVNWVKAGVDKDLLLF